MTATLVRRTASCSALLHANVQPRPLLIGTSDGGTVLNIICAHSTLPFAFRTNKVRRFAN